MTPATAPECLLRAFLRDGNAEQRRAAARREARREAVRVEVEFGEPRRYSVEVTVR
jgi:hypothetical protein